jgi:hypothetical protein
MNASILDSSLRRYVISLRSSGFTPISLPHSVMGGCTLIADGIVYTILDRIDQDNGVVTLLELDKDYPNAVNKIIISLMIPLFLHLKNN